MRAAEQPKDFVEGIKVIRHNCGGVNLPDDESYPFVADIKLRAPQFMGVAFAFIYGGTEELRVRGMTRKALARFLEVNGLLDHPRLIGKVEIDGPTEPEEKKKTAAP